MIQKQSIRELKALQAKALELYHAEYQRLEAQIQSIRGLRGTKLKIHSMEDYVEAGRSSERVPGMGQHQ